MVKLLVIAHRHQYCDLMKRRVAWIVVIFMALATFPGIVQASASTTVIDQINYPFVAALARASILADQPVAPTTQKITFQFESGVPLENQNMIKDGADNLISHFGNILNYSGTAIGIIAYKTVPGGLALAKAFDPADSYFQGDMTRTFALQVDPEVVPTVGMGGFSVGYKRLVVVEAPYFKTSNATLPTYPGDPVVITHELAHEVQASINKGSNMRNPVWLCEGGAQVIGAALSVFQGQDYWAVGGRDAWSRRIPANRTIADLKIMEGETDPKHGATITDDSQILSEYTTGAALTEYLIAKGGFANSLLVNQLSFKSGGGMASFRTAFQKVYGESLDDFYAEALPYVNYVSANWKSTYASSPEALAFITDRLGTDKAAATVAAASKIAAEKLISDAKAAMELKAKQDADAVSDLLPKFQSEGCHAGSALNATLQKLVGTAWVDVADARGWTLISTCPATNQYEPWTNADVTAGTNVRWHISATNAWDWYSATQIAIGTSAEVLKAVAELKAKQAADSVTAAEKAAADLKLKQEADAKAAAEKAAADLKAKQEAEAKAAADKVAADLKAQQDAAAKAAADKVAASKKITITCIKGTLTKKVTALKPVCPAGYKKKP